MTPDYTNQVPPASEAQLLAISTAILDIRDNVKQMPELVKKVDHMTFQLEQLSKDHSQTRQDLQQTRTSINAELKIIKEDMEPLKTNKTVLDTLRGQFKLAGMAVIGALVTGWLNFGAKLDINTAMAATNSQKLSVIEKTQEERANRFEKIQSQIDDLKTTIYTSSPRRNSNYETDRQY